MSIELRKKLHRAKSATVTKMHSVSESTPLLNIHLPSSSSSTFSRAFWGTLKSSPANVLLVFVPLGIVAGAVGWSPTAIFILNFLAIIPLAALLSFATEELSESLGETLSGLLNASFGNAVELIVSIVALRQGEIRIVQSSMLGSVLSNILLVLGCCFLSGAFFDVKEANFQMIAASTMSSLLAVASASLIIPATLYAVMRDSSKDAESNVLLLSRGTSIIMLVLYILYLVFQLKTHKDYFAAEAKDESAAEQGQAQPNGDESEHHENTHGGPVHEPRDEKSTPTLPPIPAGIVLVLVTVCVAVCAEYLVDSIDSIVSSTGISKTFIGLILLPIVGNAAEHVTAVVVSYHGKMDLAIGVAIGSSIQIALLVTPFLVILGWIIGQPMSLHFQTFETVVFFLSVLVVNYLIQDGKSNYLEGAMLIGIYTIIAIAFFVYPDDASDVAEPPRWNVLAEGVKTVLGR